MAKKKPTALVAGGAGFLGSHLIDRLLARGYAVTCLDNFSTGRWANLAHLQSHPDFEAVDGDICDPIPPLEADEVWNLACPASPPKYQIDPIQTMMTNTLGTRNLLEVARANGAKFFQASTSEVYGDPEVHPQPEHYVGAVKTTGPRACYDEGKRAAETLCIDYHRHHGVDIRIARIFNTYGPRMDPEDGRVVSNFVVNALKGEPLELHGSGSQTRSFCYVDDMIEGFVRLMDQTTEIGPVNIGNPHEVTVAELAELVLAKLKSPSGIRSVDGLIDDPKQRKPDIRQATEKLGWAPRVPLEKGLEQTAAYFVQVAKVNETVRTKHQPASAAA